MKIAGHFLAILTVLALATGDASAARGKNGNSRGKSMSARSGSTEVRGFTQRLSFAEAFYRNVRRSGI